MEHRAHLCDASPMRFPLDPSAYTRPVRRKLPHVDARARTQTFTGRLALRMTHLIRAGAPGTPLSAIIDNCTSFPDGSLTITWKHDAEVSP